MLFYDGNSGEVLVQLTRGGVRDKEVERSTELPGGPGHRHPYTHRYKYKYR